MDADIRNHSYRDRICPDYSRNRNEFCSQRSGRGGALDSAFAQFIERHPAYRVPDSIRQRLSNMNCHCLNFQCYIYFEKDPKEVYLTTYDYNSGVIDIIYIPKADIWKETRSSRLDSLDKIRVRSRLIREVLDSLPATTHF
jgi:hypothetical protein